MRLNLIIQNRVLIILLCLFLSSCDNTKTIKTERIDEPTIYTVPDSDKEMNTAIQKAVHTLDKFNDALKSRDTNYSLFALKERFSTRKGYEHIWINSIVLKDQKYFGVVNNEPESTTEVKLGDTIQVPIDKISDWMYLDRNKLRGGYTMRLLRDRMTTKERMQFDSENKIIIDDND